MKKILIVNTALVGEASGTGNTMENIFGSYPKDDLMQLCTTRKLGNERTTIPNTVYLDMVLGHFFRGLRNTFTGNKNAFASALPADSLMVTNDKKSKPGLKRQLRKLFRAIVTVWPKTYRREYKKLDEFHPDVIFTYGASALNIKVSNKLAKRYKCKIIMHMLDDWAESLFADYVLLKPFRYDLKRAMEKAHENSVTNFAISQPLCNKYEKIYGKEYISLMNPAVNIVESVRINDTDCIKFIYAGSLTLNRWINLLEIAETLCALRKKGLNNSFELYAPSFMVTKDLKKKFEEKGATLSPYLPASAVAARNENSDIFVITESFEESILDFIKFSLSAKIPESMAAGKPIFAYLDKCLHNSEYLKQTGAGVVAHNSVELNKCAELLINDKELRKKVATMALKTAKTEHSKERAIGKLIRAVELSCAIREN